ncbi:TPA: hypothetical protein EYN65_06650, partial [Candidatus Poribacteria bacterium]|nr:hypothetical protein [Candidatus Poribacteria bacterium]
LGNVYEWCQDWYGEDYYSNSAATKNLPGPGTGSYRVLRGGSWTAVTLTLRVANRDYSPPYNRYTFSGFRCVSGSLTPDSFTALPDAPSKPVTEKPIEEVVTPPTVNTITFKSEATSLTADGKSTAALTINLNDAANKPVSGQTITLTTDIGQISQAKDNQDGSYTATYTAGTKAGEATITATTSNGKSNTIKIQLTEQEVSEFVVSVLKPELSISAGGFVTYLITLQGKGGFTDTIDLFASDYPKGVEASFNPKQVKLTADDPVKTVQLTVITPKEIEAKDHSITILSTSQSGKVQKSTITLKVEISDLALTTIIIVVDPKEVALGDSLKVVGQLVSIAEPAVDIPANSEINLTLTSPAGTITEFKVNTTDEGDYQLATPYTPDEVGEWEISANFAGTKTLKSSKRSTKFKVAKGSAVIAFDNADTALLGTELELVGNLKPQLADQKISIKIIKPDGSVPTP